jgi:formate dehydrogenase major subunit
MSVRRSVARWPVLRQLRGMDRQGVGAAAQSDRSRAWRARTEDPDRTVASICPYCAVGCGQLVHVKDGEVTHIEGDPASPISRGRLCPKGQASRSLSQSPLRQYRVRYRRPYATVWEDLPLEQAMEMIADRIVAARADTWEEVTASGAPARRTMGIAQLGGATLDNEENYLMRKLTAGLGIIQVENQARI